MKKLILFLAGILFYALTFSNVPTANAIASIPEPFCTNVGEGSDTLYAGGHNITIAQSFTTTLDTVTSASLNAFSYNNFSGRIVVAIYEMPGATIPTNGITNRTFSNMSAEAQEYNFKFPDLVDVNNSSTYWLTAWIDGASTGTFYWKTALDSCYPGGHQYINTTESYNIDMGFSIWGYNNELPAVDSPDPTPSTPSPTPSSTTPSSTVTLGAAPATPTASIKAPTEVTIADIPSDEGGSLKLDWKASVTTDITGYKVFRSTTDVTKDFKELAKTEKAVLTYTDTAATVGQKFYYMVRAYKDAKESASSNIVNAISADNIAPAVPKNLVMKADADTGINFTWDANTEADLAGYVLSVISSEDDATVIDSIDLDKAAISFDLKFADRTKLTAGTDYLYYLQAKDANGNLSERVIFPAEAAAVADTATTNESSADLFLIISIIILILLAAGLTYWELKAKKDGKKVPGKLLWPVVGLMVIAAGIIVWRVMPEKAETASTAKNEEVVFTPKHADWPVFDSAKNGFKLYHPAEYTVTEGAGGNVSINKGAEIVGEVYFYNNNGDEAGMMRSSGALYMDGTKGYMTGGVESSVAATTEKISAKKYTGTFGKNAGAKVMVHDGVKGSVFMFSKNDKTWQVFSFDNGDAAAQAIFDDMIADMKF